MIFFSSLDYTSERETLRRKKKYIYICVSWAGGSLLMAWGERVKHVFLTTAKG